MSDQQKHSDSPLNAFYAALLHGKLSLGSLGSSFGAAPTGAATKRKQGQQLPELAKRQKEDRQNATQNPSKSPRAYQEAAQGKSNEQQCSTQRASASTAKMSDQEQKGSASSGKEAVPAWQKIDSGGSEDEGLQEDEAKRTRRKSHSSAKLSKQADKPPSSSRPEAVAVHQTAAKQQSSPAKARNSLPSEHSVLACLQTYFPPVEGFDQAAQGSASPAQRTVSEWHVSQQQEAHPSGKGTAPKAAVRSRNPSGPETPPQSASQGRAGAEEEAACQTPSKGPGSQILKPSSTAQESPAQSRRKHNSAAVWQQHLHERQHNHTSEAPNAQPSCNIVDAPTSQGNRAAGEREVQASEKEELAASKGNATAAQREQLQQRASNAEVTNVDDCEVIDLASSSDEGGSAASSPSSRNLSQLESGKQLQSQKQSGERKYEESEEKKKLNPVPPTLLSALGMRQAEATSPGKPQALPAKPGLNQAAMVKGCKPSLLADFPKPKFGVLPYSNCVLPKDMRHFPKTTDHRHDRLPRPGEKAPHVSKKMKSGDALKGHAAKPVTSKSPQAASPLKQEPRPITSRLKSLQATKQMSQQAQMELAPRTKCEAKGVPVYFYSDDPPQDPDMPPARREPEQDVQRAKDTVSIWGNFQTKPRNGADTRIMPVSSSFHISSITDPNFKLGGKPFKYCFPLQDAKPGKPDRIIGEERRALRKFAGSGPS